MDPVGKMHKSYGALDSSVVDRDRPHDSAIYSGSGQKSTV